MGQCLRHYRQTGYYEGKETNGATASSNITKSPAADIIGFDWMAQQNGGQFDPVLFGDYRDPQDNILNNSFGDYFNDAFPSYDFTSPYNTSDIATQPPKKDFMKEIEVRENGSPGALAPSDKKEDFLPCDKLWSVPFEPISTHPLTLFFLGIVFSHQRRLSRVKRIWMICARSSNQRRNVPAKGLSLLRVTSTRSLARRRRQTSSRCSHRR